MQIWRRRRRKKKKKKEKKKKKNKKKKEEEEEEEQEQEEEEEEEEGDIVAVWRLSGLVLQWCFLAPLGVLFVMKTIKDERQVVIAAYKLVVFEILRDFFVLASIIIFLPHYLYI